MVRRRVAAGIGVLIVIVIVLLIASAIGGGDEAGLKHYNQSVDRAIEESDQQVGKPLFNALGSATGAKPLEVESQIDQLRAIAESQASRVDRLEVPSGMEEPQRYFSLAMSLRAEGLTKIASQVRAVLGGGQATQASRNIAGAMETFLASEIVYSQRVVPLIHETLRSKGIGGQPSAPTHFLADSGWLEPETVFKRLTGRAPPQSSTGPLAPGTHGSKLAGVSVGGATLEPRPALNHLTGAPNPTFTVMVENSGENSQANVGVQVTVEAEGKQLKASRTIAETVPGKTVGEEVTVHGVPTGADARVAVEIKPVRGETNTANNRGHYLATFSK